MKGIAGILMISWIMAAILPQNTEGRCSSSQTIRRVYVIRRSLHLFDWVINWCVIAHSGLILEMSDGKQCVLEYMEDGRSHLYDANPTSTRNCWFSSCKKLQMKDDKGISYEWTRQRYGISTATYPLAKVSPQEAQRQMQSMMGTKYDLIKNNCHVAQEGLRKSWKMKVDKQYKPSLKSICGCKLPSWLRKSFKGLLAELVKDYCKQKSA